MTKSELKAPQKPIEFQLNGATVHLVPKEFSSGNVGWYAGEKLSIKLPNGEVVRCQLSMSLTVIGSKSM